MAEEKQALSQLVLMRIVNALSGEQEAELDKWATRSSANENWLKQWDNPEFIASELRLYNNVDVDAAINGIWKRIDVNEAK
ncbi:MAG TPA: hypothetical protein VEA58_14050 [Anaerovoracaceae bacterium]|nr:hypothetical protein [Anaerovoracaceae bacterium]